MMPLSRIRSDFFPQRNFDEEIILGEHSLKLSRKERQCIDPPTVPRFLMMATDQERVRLREEREVLRDHINQCWNRHLDDRRELERRIVRSDIASQLLQTELQEETQKFLHTRKKWMKVGGAVGGAVGTAAGCIHSSKSGSSEALLIGGYAAIGAATGAGAAAAICQYKYSEPVTSAQRRVTVNEETLTLLQNELEIINQTGSYRLYANAVRNLQAFDEQIMDSPPYQQWAVDIYRVAIPILMQFLTIREEIETIERRIECAISLDWMRDPVSTNDGHVYEKDRLEIYLQEKIRKGLSLESPLRNGDIDLQTIRRERNHYINILNFLKNNYDRRVRDQQEQYTSAAFDPTNPAIVYYQDPERRERAVDAMIGRLMDRRAELQIPAREFRELVEDLNSCVELPKCFV